MNVVLPCHFRLNIRDAHPALIVWAGLWLGFAPGCTVGPDYTPPIPEMPDAWHQELSTGLKEGEANLQTWWTAFNDPILETLIERAAQGNLELREAAWRIAEARARFGIASGEKFPAVDAVGAYQRNQISEEIVPFPALSDAQDFYQVGFDASWEIDVFGRIRRSVESADAAVTASVEGYRDVLVSLFA